MILDGVGGWLRIELMFMFIVEEEEICSVDIVGRVDSGFGRGCELLKVKFPFEMGRDG